MLFDDYLCFVASNKQQIQWTRIQSNQHKHWITGNTYASADSFKHKVVIAMKSEQIQYLAFGAIWWQEDKYVLQQQQASK